MQLTLCSLLVCQFSRQLYFIFEKNISADTEQEGHIQNQFGSRCFFACLQLTEVAMRGLPKSLCKLFKCKGISCTEKVKFLTKSSDRRS